MTELKFASTRHNICYKNYSMTYHEFVSVCVIVLDIDLLCSYVSDRNRKLFGLWRKACLYLFHVIVICHRDTRYVAEIYWILETIMSRCDKKGFSNALLFINDELFFRRKDHHKRSDDSRVVYQMIFNLYWSIQMKCHYGIA